MIIAAMMLASCGSKTTTKEKDMNTLSFNHEQAAFMSAIACNEAKADYAALAEAINGGLDAGLTISQIKEALSQLYAYTGFPRSLNALGTLQKVLEQRKAKAKSLKKVLRHRRCRAITMLWHKVRKYKPNFLDSLSTMRFAPPRTTI